MKKIYVLLPLVLVFICISSCGEQLSPELVETTKMTDAAQSASADTSLAQKSCSEDLKAIFSQGNATQEDMHILYNREKELLENIAAQTNLDEVNFRYAHFFSGKLITKYNDDAPGFTSARLEELIAKYFDIVGLKQSPAIINFARDKMILFYINAPNYGNPDYTRIAIVYSTDLVLPHWTKLEDDWYIYTEKLPTPNRPGQ
jgi:hypothetical protein